MMLRVEGAPADRARRLFARMWTASLVLFIAVTVATFLTRPDAAFNQWIDTLGVAALAALVATLLAARARREFVTFAASSAYIVLLLAVAAATMFPNLLRGFPDGRGSLSVFAVSPSPAAVATALGAGITGMAIVLVYTTVLWRKLAGKVRVGE
jgi:cytochrome bd ubiquinol oxidase subunit II